jgi:ATP-binding cassette subfamily B protein/subfamily B ATP-binding cassette protein MsbA
VLLLKVGLNVLKPWPMVLLVDHVLKKERELPSWAASMVEALPGGGTDNALIAWAVLGTVVLFLLSWAAGVAESFAGIRLGQRMVYDVASQLFARLQQLSLRFHSSGSVGDNLRRVTGDSTCVATMFRDALLPATSALVSIALMCAILLRVNVPLTLLAFAIVPILVWAFRLYAKPMLELGYRQQEVECRVYEVIDRTISAVPMVQACGREGSADQMFRDATGASMSATLDLTHVQVRFKVLVGFATALGTAGILWFGGQLGLQGQFSVGNILLFLSYLGALYAPVESLMYMGSTLQSAAGSARRVLEVMHAHQDVADHPRARPMAQVRGRVQFDQVTFGYAPERPVLSGVSLEIEPGETVALVGPTGAGKSTLVSLIPRFFDPQQGTVRIDGVDLREIRLKSLRASIAVVLQEPLLFPLTIAENIAYGRPEASLQEIQSAARVAGAHEFISRLETGYRTEVGERGATLSVGQRQRISIARALLRQAPFLILDEPTSALDAETEQAVIAALKPLCEGRTTFIIAHRLSTIRHAHRIIFLERGRVVECGTAKELLQRGGRYAQFHKLQFEHLTGKPTVHGPIQGEH